MRRPIQILPPEIAERIAAGEVIERPAAVVKELLENALDAGATDVAVHLSEGGKAEIEVTDNGEGIPASELQTALQRHATSKLRDLADLDRILTLGFRGEALPSIAAVTQLTLLSRAKGSDSAYEIIGGIPGLKSHSAPVPRAHGQFLGKPHGTRIQAQGLFAQVPARLKFLKSPATEATQVKEWMERLALARPEVGFTLTHHQGTQTKTLLNLKPQSEAERVAALLSDGEDTPVVSHSETHPFLQLEVRAHWLQGLSLPQTRKLVQVVNGRAIRDRLLQQAVLNPFRQLNLPGQFPAVALILEIPPSAVDVNVHPTKSEVRFLEPTKVFRAVQETLQQLIQKEGGALYVSGVRGVHPQAGDDFQSPSPEPTQSFRQEQPRELRQESFELSRRNFNPPTPPQEAFHFFASAPPSGQGVRSPALTTAPHQGLLAISPLPIATAPLPRLETESTRAPEEAQRLHFRQEGTLGKFLGILFNTYLLFENRNELWLVDQHAAHERIHYEKFKNRFCQIHGSSESQPLLIPEPIQLDALVLETLEPRLALLHRIGFEAEPFGEASILFRAVPPDWGSDSLHSRLKSLLLRLAELDETALARTQPGVTAPHGERPPPPWGEALDWAQLKLDESIFEKLATSACKASVRAGDRITDFAALRLAEDLLKTAHPWNCPHGRPTLVKIPEARFEEWFLRRAPQVRLESH